MLSRYTDACSVSGSSTMITSASSQAPSMDVTFSPAAAALACDDEPSRRPMRTSMPDAWRFSAWAWPCDP